MGKACDLIHGLKPAMMMVTVQLSLTGVNILYKLAGNNGFSLRVLIAYRFLFAAVSVSPLALIFERKNRPKLTWKIGFQAFTCAFFGGSLSQNLYAESLVLTSATFAAAMTNLIPAATFILAVFFGLERLGLNSKSGNAKVVGTLVCIGGAMVLTFYKGCEVKIWSTHFDLLNESDGHVATAHHKSIDNILGPILSLLCCLFASISLIIQAKMSERYPYPYSSTALISIMGSIQAVVFAICMERDWSQWKLGWNLRLLTVAYIGVVASGLMWVFIMSCVRMRGPLFVSVFSPLMLVLVALAGSLLLNEKLYLGSVIGAAIIICGLYAVLWGKNKEMKKISRLIPGNNSTETTTDVNIGEITRDKESFRGFNHAGNVMAVTPIFFPTVEVIEDSDDEDDPEDLEANKVSNLDQPKSSTSNLP